MTIATTMAMNNDKNQRYSDEEIKNYSALTPKKSTEVKPDLAKTAEPKKDLTGKLEEPINEELNLAGDHELPNYGRNAEETHLNPSQVDLTRQIRNNSQGLAEMMENESNTLDGQLHSDKYEQSIIENGGLLPPYMEAATCTHENKDKLQCDNRMAASMVETRTGKFDRQHMYN
jgi:hypothetical protein